MPVASPCINLCLLDEAGRHCTGCFRTLGEIAAWPAMDEGERQRVLDDIERRRCNRAA